MDQIMLSNNVLVETGGHWSPGGVTSRPTSPSKECQEIPHRRKKYRGRFSPSTVLILEEWLLAHRSFPYATPQDQDELKARSGLKRSQILSWIANARKRGKVQPIPIPQQSASTTLQPPPSLTHLHPFERWLYSGPDTEFATPSDILKAVNDIQSRAEPITQQGVCSTEHRLQRANWLYFHQCSSEASSMEVRSYAANIRSVCSDEWKDFSDSPATDLVKRRHRRPCSKSETGISGSHKNDGMRIFQCTFCTASFKKKHDWERHEKSRHLPLESWTCCSQGSVHVDPATNEVTCVFCGHHEPDPAHIQAHSYTQCVARPVHERTFVRKDHLRQHIRLIHGASSFHPSMEAWKNDMSQLRSRCGFCHRNFDNWKARVTHIADHFRHGALMSDWVGDWGLETEVSKLLEHAVLPASRSLDNSPEAKDRITGVFMNAGGTTESAEFTWENYLDTLDFNNEMETYSRAFVEEFLPLTPGFNGNKNHEHIHQSIDDCIGGNWLVDDYRSETVTTSSGGQQQETDGDIDLDTVNWYDYLEKDLLDLETHAVPISDCLSLDCSQT